MKKFLSLSMLVLVAATAAALPKFIGHRGSYWGVENTAEAFIAGAEKGYHYLETDVKVAKDGTFVLTHDDETSRLGGSLNITQATIEQLKAETYTQTRGGVTYTGKICTLEEYLQICKDYKVVPFIELKWATGINNNDCSNLGRLVDKVIEYGFGSTAVINTSMKTCLEYVRKNYPDFKLMFLCNTNWETNFDWCVAQNIGPYIQTGCFDKNTVTKFHEKDLKVGVWTVNTPANYTVYGNYGCDLIAVDYLDPVGLPELDPFSALVPNKIDYPDHRGIIQQEYVFEQTATVPESGTTVKKAVANESGIFLLDAEGMVMKIDMETAKPQNPDLSAAGKIADIAMTADGLLAVCSTPVQGKAKIWLDETSGMKELAEIENCTALPAFCISGTSSDWKIYYTAGDGIRAISSDGLVAVNSITLDVQQPSLAVSPFSRDNIIIDSPTVLPAEYAFNWEESGTPLMPFMAAGTESGISPQQAAIAPFRYGVKVYAATYSGTGFRLTDISNGLASAKPTDREFSGPAAGTGTFVAAFAKVDKGDIHICTLFDSAITCYTAKGEEPEGNIGETDFRIEKLWSFTDKEGNAPEHIDGTNAQQGAAYKGTFYINDCNDRLVYVYTKDGLAGSLPGGAGWGCATDDAGNIIIRNDKATGTDHSLLIYPAGTMPGDGTEAIAVDFTKPDAGQTNFISAGGDVLGEGGYVYLFPNKQSTANLVRIEEGRFVESSRSGSLSIEGSTAGYIVPIKNNPEHWLYMVRNQGIYRYNGADAGLLLGGSSTRPPSRNSTCGAEIFTLSSHEILVFNSGANYKGGFSIKDLTDNKYIETITPIGDKGYQEGGNYSVSNWMTAEKIDAGSYYLYQYCPANGIAVYRFWDANYVPESGVGATVIPDSRLTVYPNPTDDMLSIDGFEGEVTVYSMSGIPVKKAMLGKDRKLYVADLPAGLYILRTGNGLSARFVKR